MVTHDIDEALFLSDRVVMMTNGPKAKVGDILDVHFPRPRIRKEVIEHPDYYRYRGHLIDFLENGHAENKVLIKKNVVDTGRTLKPANEFDEATTDEDILVNESLLDAV